MLVYEGLDGVVFVESFGVGLYQVGVRTIRIGACFVFSLGPHDVDRVLRMDG